MWFRDKKQKLKSVWRKSKITTKNRFEMDVKQPPRKIVWKMPSADVSYVPKVTQPKLIPSKPVPQKTSRQNNKQRNNRPEPEILTIEQINDGSLSPKTMRIEEIKRLLYLPIIETKAMTLINKYAFMTIESIGINLRVSHVEENEDGEHETPIDKSIPEIVKFLKIISEMPNFAALVNSLHPNIIQLNEKQEDIDTLKAISCKMDVILHYSNIIDDNKTEYIEHLTYSDNIADELREIPWDRPWRIEIQRSDIGPRRMGPYSIFSGWDCSYCKNTKTTYEEYSRLVICSNLNVYVFIYLANIYLGRNVYNEYMQKKYNSQYDNWVVTGDKDNKDTDLCKYIVDPFFMNGFIDLHCIFCQHRPK